MSKDPAVLFYTSDFLTGTMTMTDEHVGMYIRLLCLQHQKGKLTEQDMNYICKSYVEDVFSKFTKGKDGFYANDRMDRESNRRKLYSESRRSNINSRYKKATYVAHMETETENITDTETIKKNGFLKPKIEQVSAYCKERNKGVDPERWYNFYEAKGWMIGKNRMKDWKAAVRTWEKKDESSETKRYL